MDELADREITRLRNELNQDQSVPVTTMPQQGRPLSTSTPNDHETATASSGAIPRTLG